VERSIFVWNNARTVSLICGPWVCRRSERNRGGGANSPSKKVEKEGCGVQDVNGGEEEPYEIKTIKNRAKPGSCTAKEISVTTSQITVMRKDRGRLRKTFCGKESPNHTKLKKARKRSRRKRSGHY